MHITLPSLFAKKWKLKICWHSNSRIKQRQSMTIKWSTTIYNLGIASLVYYIKFQVSPKALCISNFPEYYRETIIGDRGSKCPLQARVKLVPPKQRNHSTIPTTLHLSWPDMNTKFMFSPLHITTNTMDKEFIQSQNFQFIKLFYSAISCIHTSNALCCSFLQYTNRFHTVSRRVTPNNDTIPQHRLMKCNLCFGQIFPRKLLC